MSKVDQLTLSKTDLNLNDSAPLPMGSSTEGAAGGSLGDASMADLTKGFVNENKADADPVPLFSDDSAGGSNATAPNLTIGGVLGRPAGWAR